MWSAKINARTVKSRNRRYILFSSSIRVGSTIVTVRRYAVSRQWPRRAWSTLDLDSTWVNLCDLGAARAGRMERTSEVSFRHRFVCYYSRRPRRPAFWSKAATPRYVAGSTSVRGPVVEVTRRLFPVGLPDSVVAGRRTLGIVDSEPFQLGRERSCGRVHGDDADFDAFTQVRFDGRK